MIFYPQSGAWDSVGKSTQECNQDLHYISGCACIYINYFREKFHLILNRSADGASTLCHLHVMLSAVSKACIRY